MKFSASVETESNSFHIEFDVENAEVARAKVGQATAEINRRFGAGTEKTAAKRGSVTADAGSSSSVPPARPTPPTATTQSSEVRKGSDHAK